MDLFTTVKTALQNSILKYFFLVWWLGSLTPLAAQNGLNTFDPKLKITQYIQDHWTTQDNLPSSHIAKIHISQKGFLWLGGFDGLVRFDGVRFVVFNKKEYHFLKSNSITTIDDGKKQLWVGTPNSGLISVENGEMQHWGYEDFNITSVFEENERKLWVGSRNKGLYLIDIPTKKAKKINNPLLENVGIYDIYQEKDSTLWFPTDGSGILRYQNKKWKSFSTKDGLPTNSVLTCFKDSQSRFWIGTTNGLCIKRDNKIELVAAIGDKIIHKILEDKKGNIWIGTSSGLYRLNALSGVYELYAYNEKIAINNITDLALDVEGSLWIATYRDGLYRLREGKFINYSNEDGLGTAAVGSVCEITPNEIWVGTNNGKINIIKQGEGISEYPLKTQIPPIRIFNIFKDSKNNIWLSTFGGLVQIQPDGSEKLWNKDNGLVDNSIRLAFEDTKGNIWIGSRWGGISILQANGKIITLDKNNGLSSNFIMAISEDKNGNIWVGTNDEGIDLFLPNLKKKQHFDEKNGLANNLIFNIYHDDENVTWIVSNSGITRHQNGTFFSFTSQEGLNNDSPFDFVEDPQKNVWLPTSKGIVCVAKKELNRFYKKEIDSINWKVFDRSDGMKSDDCTGATHSLLTQQGVVFVPTNGGLVSILPNKLPINPVPPPVHINRLLTDGVQVDISSDKVIVAHKVQRLIFDYSGLSYLAPAKVKFKYRLINFDKDWVDAGNERQAVYTNIPAGNYTFQVIACNNDGIWNEVGDSVELVIEPAFYETIWFYLLIPILFFSGIFSFYRWRLRNIQAKNKELDFIVKERTAEITEQTRNITSSIEYAKLIQEATLPSIAKVQSMIPQSLIFFQPKDIVSGDFYWISEMEEYTLLAVADCTGHGVPGAFMSLIGNNLLNEIINLKGEHHPSNILKELQTGILEKLNQKDSQRNDGMEIGICKIYKNKKLLEYAGSRLPLIYVQNGNIYEVTADKIYLGGMWQNQSEADKYFHTQSIPIHEPTWFYLLSDGYKDQFGGKYGKKLMRRATQDILIEASKHQPNQQQVIIKQRFDEWKGSRIQIDDVVVVGFQLGNTL